MKQNQPDLCFQAPDAWMKEVLQIGRRSCQVLLLADRFMLEANRDESGVENCIPRKRTAPDNPPAPVHEQNPQIQMPDSFGSTSSHDDDVSAYRLQALGQERCDKVIKAAPAFVCQRGTAASISQAAMEKVDAASTDVDTSRFMQTILNGLDDLIHAYTSCGEEWRMRNYELARVHLAQTFGALLQRKATFRSCEELQAQIQHHGIHRAGSIGEKTWGKLRDIEEWGSSSKAEALMNEHDAVLKRQLGGMWGIGPSLLNKFWSRGCRSREQVLQQPDCPTRCKVADKHYDDMQLRMPRCEVDVISKIIFQQILQNYKGGELKFEVVGSFRRGRLDSGDVDCLLSPHDHKLNSGMLPGIIDLLEAQGLAFDHLQLPNRNREWVGKNTYMGFTRLPDSATSIKLTGVGGSCATGAAVLCVPSGSRKLLLSICTKDLSSATKAASLGTFDQAGRQRQLVCIASHKFQNGHVSLETYPDSSVLSLLQKDAPCWLSVCTQLYPDGELTSQFRIGCSEHASRRLDIKVYPPEQFPTALLYFTGSAHFNRSMRLFAHNSGFLLNDYGLFKRPFDSTRSRNQHQKSIEKPHGDLVRCLTERDVFTHLKLNYVEPERRHDQGDVVAFR
jgi:DNA polymerase/3'-5' exonuclease PolX